MMYAIFRDDKIQSILCGRVIEGMGAVPLPDDFRGVVGMHRAEFLDDWSVRPLSERVEAGHVQAPRGWKAVGDAFIEMSQAEKYRYGVDPVPDGMVLDGEILRQMTQAEAVAAGQMTEEEAAVRERDEAIAALTAYLSSTDWYAVRYAETGVAIPEDLSARRAAARARISELRDAT